MSRIDRLEVGAMRLLVVIHDAQSFSEAARRLGIGQSTVSYTMRHLRTAFDDPLFIRVGNRVEPTPRCLEVVEDLRPLLTRLGQLAESGPFDPAQASGAVTISCNFHERRFLVPAAVARIRAAAPGLRLHLHEAAVDGKRQLTANLADIVLGPVAMLGEIFYRRHLFTDRYVCVMDAANPLARRPLTLEAYRDAAHLSVTHNGRWEAFFHTHLRAEGIGIEAAVTVPSHDALEALLPGSDLLATIPERLALDLGQGPEQGRLQGTGQRSGQGSGQDRGLVIRPFPLDVPIRIDMYWTERTHLSGAHVWVRQVLADTARDLMQRIRQAQ